MKHGYFISLLAAVLLTGCGSGYTVNVKNLAEVGISRIEVKPEAAGGSMVNYLDETLPAGETVELDLGKLSEGDASEGFALEVYSAEDNTSQTFGNLHFASGDTVTFYLDDWGLAAAVNMTDEEVAELKEADHKAYLEGIDDTEPDNE